jgi:hypothetical protein
VGCLVAATTVTVLVHAPTAGAGSYKCYVRDTVTSGIVPNTIRADGSVDCSGYGGPGSVRFSVRGIFRAALRDSAGYHVSTNVQRLGNLRVLQGCAVDNPFEGAGPS